jgi:hypothetical protein
MGFAGENRSSTTHTQGNRGPRNRFPRRRRRVRVMVQFEIATL